MTVNVDPCKCCTDVNVDRCAYMQLFLILAWPRDVVDTSVAVAIRTQLAVVISGD